ncbi:hypothetical protein EDB86DRAFT_2835413 [Lactarius hatsudake]|nr:hypothetical protein EDB86DRAFT_2835413 [Lactarius hatsudake]
MPRKNTYTIPMGDVVEVVTETQWTARDSTPLVEPTVDQVQSQSFGQPSRGEEESHTLQPMEPYENDMPAIQMEDTQPQANISPPIARDGGSDKCSKVLHVYQIDADQVFRLYWGQLPLQGLLPLISYAVPIPSDVPLDWFTLCTNIINGIQAAQEPRPSGQKPRRTRSASLISVKEEDAPSPGALLPPSHAPEYMEGISDTLFDLSGDMVDPSDGYTQHTQTAKLGNPLITIVNQTGVFDMDVLFCICPNAGANDEQLLQAGLFPSTFNTIPNFKASPIGCSPTMSHVTDGDTQNLYKQLLRASRQWRDLKNRIQSGLGHQNGGIPTTDGSMAIFCPACPQPGINLPDDWKIRNQLIQTFIMDGNFSAEHMRCRTGETDVPLSSGMAFMANPNSYKAHLHSGQEVSQPSTCNTYRAIEQANSSRPHLDVTGIGATACCHGFFVPTSVVDFQKGESICKALSYNMEDIPAALVMYDIMCQYGVHFQQRVERSPELSLSDSLQLRTGIGLFHIHGHQDSCLPHFSPSYIPRAKQVDGEIIETLWAPLNNVSRSICRMSLAHRQEVLDAHMKHSNWKKMVHIVPSLLKQWKHMDTGIDLSADILDTLNTRFKTKTKRWLKAAKHAQSSRHEDPTVMDIYDTMTPKAPSRAVIQQQLISEESGDITTHGQTSWIACGIKIQELQLAIRYQIRAHGLKITTEEIQVIENKWSRLQTLIDIFEHQGDSFLLQPLTDDSPISPLGDYAQYDHLEDLTNSKDTDDDHLEHGRCHTPLRAIDGSGMDGTNPKDFLVLLPSSLGWEWCVRHGIQSLAGKEVQLRHAQASESIHEIRLALGFKSALFRTQV